MELQKFISTIIHKNLNEDIFKTDNSVKKYEKLIVDAIINFLKEEWSFDANIVVKKKQNNSLLGDITLNSNSINHKKFTVHFNPNQSYLEIIKSLMHELTHVKQVAKGELRPREDWKAILWKDNFELNVRDYNKITKDFSQYKELPWEKEAYHNMSDTSLRNTFFTSKHWTNLKGKDSTLDFIIDNLKS